MKHRESMIEDMCATWEAAAGPAESLVEKGGRETLKARMAAIYDQHLTLLHNAENDDSQSPVVQESADRHQVCLDLCDGIDTESLRGKSLETYVVEQAFLQGMQPYEGGFEFEFSGLAAQMLAASFAGQFKGSGATNFLEFRMSHPETGPFTITMQRSHGKSPGQLRSEANEARDQALAACMRARDLLRSYQSGLDAEWIAAREELLETPIEVPHSQVVTEAQIRLLREHAEREERQRFRFNDRRDSCAYAALQARNLANELEASLGEQSAGEDV